MQRKRKSKDRGGIEGWKTPDLIFIIDTNIGSLAVAEVKKLGIPIIAILDTNSDPTEQINSTMVMMMQEDLLIFMWLLKTLIKDAESLLAAQIDPEEKSRKSLIKDKK